MTKPQTASDAGAGGSAPAGLTVRAAVPEDARAMDEFVLSAEHGTFFHLTGWTRAVVEQWTQFTREP